MSGKNAVNEIHRALQRELKSRSTAEDDIDQLLGLKSGGFRKQRSRSILRVEDLFDILEFLDLDPEDFFGGLAVVRRKRLKGEVLQPCSQAALADQVKYESPSRALQILKPLSQCEDSAIHRAIGSTFRLLELPQVADSWLVRSLRYVSAGTDRAESLRRIAVCRGPYYPTEALLILSRAEQMFTADSSLGQLVVNRAGIYLATGRSQDALNECEVAKSFNLTPRCLAAVHHYRALIFEKSDPPRALSELQDGLDVGQRDNLNIGHLLWTAGRIAQNHMVLSRALDAFGSEHIYYAVGVGLELCRLFPSLTPVTISCLHDLSVGTRFRRLLTSWVEEIAASRPIKNPQIDAKRIWGRWRAALVEDFSRPE